jgi:GT2 family glycosyltransferase
MTEQAARESVSVIVPTIGRPESLIRMLDSLARQSVAIRDVVVADGSADSATASVVADERWARRGLAVIRVAVQPPNAVRQRVAAIAESSSDFLLLVDDDVVLETDCVEQMLSAFRQNPAIAGVFGDFNNQSWPMPTRAWRFYLRFVLGMKDHSWQGRVVGPLLRFGYNPPPSQTMPIEWLGTCNTMIRRSAYEQAGGFSDFFLHRCTMNEDVDLGLKISKFGQIVFCPAARVGHYHASDGRVSPMIAAEDDLYNRFLVMHRTQQRSASAAFALAFLFFSIETASSLAGSILRLRSNDCGARLGGRVRALFRIVAQRRSVRAGR